MRIIFEKNGKLCVATPVVNCGLSLEQIIAKTVPAGADYKIVEEKDIPKDRSGRNGWKIEGFFDRGLVFGEEKFQAAKAAKQNTAPKEREK